MNSLMKKAQSYYNFQAELKKNNIIANRKWGQTENPTLPIYKKIIIKRNTGMINFFLQLRP